MIRARRAVATPVISGNGLELRPWDNALVTQMAAWGERGFPYNPFDVGFLRDPARAAAAVLVHQYRSQHRHFIATEGGVAVGRVSLNLEDSEGLYFWGVHVPPEHEGRGVCRRMLATLMESLERSMPGRDFVLISNAFAGHAHRAYTALGFTIADTRWQHDRELEEALLTATEAQVAALAGNIRFAAGRWEIRAHLFRRRAGAPMSVGWR